MTEGELTFVVCDYDRINVYGCSRGDNVAPNPGNNLHVSGLNIKIDTKDLEAAFAKAGRVCGLSLK